MAITTFFAGESVRYIRTDIVTVSGRGMGSMTINTTRHRGLAAWRWVWYSGRVLITRSER